MAEYTYKITNIITQEFYYGSRYRNINLNLSPQEDLWCNYFTSSKNIELLIEKFGKESFVAQIIYEQSIYDPEDTYYWKEQELIKENIKNPLCLNGNYIDAETGIKKFSRAGIKESTEIKLQKSIRAKQQQSSLTEKEKGIIAEKKRNTYFTKTTEEKNSYGSKMSDIGKKARQIESLEVLALRELKRKETISKKTIEEKLIRNNKISSTKQAKTQDEKNKTNAKRAETRANWTEEVKLKLKQKKSKATSDYYKNKRGVDNV